MSTARTFEVIAGIGWILWTLAMTCGFIYNAIRGEKDEDHG